MRVKSPQPDLNSTYAASVTPAILVGVDLGLPHFDTSLSELHELARSAGLAPVAHLTCKRKSPDPALFVGSGIASEIKALAMMHGAREVLFDQALSPAQQRNLEREFELPVYDRILVILEIFAQRARSHEGKLQIELARLQYLSTRLVRRWSHLERQRGGIGTRGGPGETQIELDRRMITDAMRRTKERLKLVKRQRHTQRQRRNNASHFGISLVGYTNAGKSTLFNILVKARVYTANQLFATLDTTTRQLYLGDALGHGRSVSLSDTVGFIRDLPHDLIDAFQATLQEAAQAQLLLHVVDAANPDHPEQIEQVLQVLNDIGAQQVPQLLVFNKIDLCPEHHRVQTAPDQYRLGQQTVDRVFVSSQTGAGLKLLRDVLAHRAMSAGAGMQAQ